MGIRVMAVDIGSVGSSSKFAWAAFDVPGRDLIAGGADPETAVSAQADDSLLAGARAALLLEAPMSVPVPGSQPGAWRRLGKARDGEGNRPWSAGAGAAALATGLAQGAWMLRQLAVTVPGLAATTQPQFWQRGSAQLLLAEAFITAAQAHLRSSRPVSMPGLTCVMSKSPPGTPIPARLPATTGPARTSTGTPTTSLPPTWPPAPDPTASPVTCATGDVRHCLLNSEHCLPGYLCTGLYAVSTSGIMPTQGSSFVSESLPSLAQADDQLNVGHQECRETAAGRQYGAPGLATPADQF